MLRLTDHPGAIANGSSFQMSSSFAMFSVAISPFPFVGPKSTTLTFFVQRVTSRPSIIFDEGKTLVSSFCTCFVLLFRGGGAINSFSAARSRLTRFSLTDHSGWAMSNCACSFAVPSVGFSTRRARRTSFKASSGGEVGMYVRIKKRLQLPESCLSATVTQKLEV